MENIKRESTEAIGGKIVNGIKDSFGVMYDLNCIRLISCQNKKIEYYDIDYGTNVIGEEAFAWCDLLKHITIPNTVETIEKGAFAWCKSLTQVIIPDSVSFIGEHAFSWCGALKYIIVSEDNLEKIKQMLPEELWRNLYCIKKVMHFPDEELPF